MSPPTINPSVRSLVLLLLIVGCVATVSSCIDDLPGVGGGRVLERAGDDHNLDLELEGPSVLAVNTPADFVLRGSPWIESSRTYEIKVVAFVPKGLTLESPGFALEPIDDISELSPFKDDDRYAATVSAPNLTFQIPMTVLVSYLPAASLNPRIIVYVTTEEQTASGAVRLFLDPTANQRLRVLTSPP